MACHQQKLSTHTLTSRLPLEGVGVGEAAWLQQGADLLDIAAAAMSGGTALGAAAVASRLWQMSSRPTVRIDCLASVRRTLRAAQRRLEAAATLLRDDEYLGDEFAAEVRAWTEVATRRIEGPFTWERCT